MKGLITDEEKTWKRKIHFLPWWFRRLLCLGVSVVNSLRLRSISKEFILCSLLFYPLINCKMFCMITTPVFLNAIVCFNTPSVVFVFWYKYRLFSMRVILGRYASFSAWNLNYIYIYIYFPFIIIIFGGGGLHRKVVEFLGLVLTQVSSTFSRPSRGFFVGVFPSLRVSPVDTYPKLRSVSVMYSVMHSSLFRFLGSVGLQ